MATIFQQDFNTFRTINATQAWSLFFSVSKQDTLLGTNPMVGKYITVGLLGALIASILEVSISAF